MVERLEEKWGNHMNFIRMFCSNKHLMRLCKILILCWIQIFKFSDDQIWIEKKYGIIVLETKLFTKNMYKYETTSMHQ